MKYLMFRGKSSKTPWNFFRIWYKFHKTLTKSKSSPRRPILWNNRYVIWLNWLDESRIFYHIEYEKEIDDFLSFYLVIENSADEMLFKLTWL